MNKYLNKLHYAKNLRIKDSLVKFVLVLFSIIYHGCLIVWYCLYRINILKTKKISAQVISVGNLTTGGTGKTPLTLEIAKYIKSKKQKNVAVLSHGYGGRFSTKGVNLISDGEKLYSDPYMAGDEPYWMALNSRDIPILTGKNRFLTGNFAIKNYNTQVVLLDDGFQHVKLHRDLDILVIDAHKKFGNHMLLPSGPLRETLDQIERADKIVVVNKNPSDQSSSQNCLSFIESVKEKYNKPVFLCNVIAGEISNLSTSKKIDEEKIKNVYAFAAIGQPEFFFNYLKEKGLNLLNTKEFKDHHLYSEIDIKNIIDEACEINVDATITTEKDAVKILMLLDKVELKVPLCSLKLKLEVDFDNLLNDVLS